MNIGDKHNMLTVIAKKTIKTSTGKPRRMVSVKCDCGTVKDIDVGDLRRGKRKSCGCIRNLKSESIEFEDKILYKSWYDINRNNLACDRWKDPKLFYQDNVGIDRTNKRLYRKNQLELHSPENSYWDSKRNLINLDTFDYPRNDNSESILFEIMPNEFIFIDSGDKDLLSQFKWWKAKGTENFYCASVYVNGKQTSKSIMQLIMFDIKADNFIQKDKGNNFSKSNILPATESQKNFGVITKNNPNKSSIYKGVSWHKHHKKWQVKIVFEGASIYLGRYDSEIEAARIYNHAALKYFGEYARINDFTE